VTLVVDCSVAVAWCIEDEAAPDTDALLERVRDEGAVVPSLWHLELGNVLLQAERRKRLKPGEVASRLELLQVLPIATDDETPARAWREVLALARSEHLTTYDAAYLELAMRRGLPLATKDVELGAAAGRVGVELLLRDSRLGEAR
jgi:predicted nucleic acid-binding protein